MNIFFAVSIPYAKSMFAGHHYGGWCLCSYHCQWCNLHFPSRCLTRHHTIPLFSLAKVGCSNFCMVIPNEYTQSWESINMYFAVSCVHSKMQVSSDPNMFHWKKNLLFFCMHQSQGCQSGTLANGSSVLMKLSPSENSPYIVLV